jgi:hypothetical protein
VPTSSHSYTIGPPEQNYYWAFPTFQPVILNYRDDMLVQHYQSDLFWSGLLLGVGIALALSVVLEMIRTASKESGV